MSWPWLRPRQRDMPFPGPCLLRGSTLSHALQQGLPVPCADGPPFFFSRSPVPAPLSAGGGFESLISRSNLSCCCVAKSCGPYKMILVRCVSMLPWLMDAWVLPGLPGRMPGCFELMSLAACARGSRCQGIDDLQQSQTLNAPERCSDLRVFSI